MTGEAPTAISGIRYDASRQRLVVRFVNGGEHLYVGVPEDVHRSFVEAPSRARFFNEVICGRFPYNKLAQ